MPSNLESYWTRSCQHHSSEEITSSCCILQANQVCMPRSLAPLNFCFPFSKNFDIRFSPNNYVAWFSSRVHVHGVLTVWFVLALHDGKRCICRYIGYTELRKCLWHVYYLAENDLEGIQFVRIMAQMEVDQKRSELCAVEGSHLVRNEKAFTWLGGC